MKSHIYFKLILAMLAIASCAGNPQVGVLTEPTSATTNMTG